MIRRPIKRQVGAMSGYGTADAYDGFGSASAGCAPACAPAVIGNAGLPGCGTGTIPGTECSLKLLFRRSDAIAAAASADIEALAGRAGAFKPRAVYMVGVGRDDNAINVRFEITNVTVMGQPQLVNFDGATTTANRGITDFFNLQCMPQPVDWMVFGTSAGQGLTVSVINAATVSGILYIAIWGDGATTDLIGKA